MGLALALHAARTLAQAQVTVLDARPAQRDVSADPRTLALSLGSVQLLQRLQAWPAHAAEPILAVHVSQAPPGLAQGAAVTLRAAEQGVPLLGAVLPYGPIVAALQAAWMEQAAREPQRLSSCFGAPVTAVLPRPGGVSLDAGIVQDFDLAVVAEGGVFDGPARLGRQTGSPTPMQEPGPGLAAFREPLRHDYGQTAWVGTVTLEQAQPGTAFERFTRHGPLALLPLPPLPPPATGQAGRARAALVWCVPAGDDPVRALTDAQRLAVLNATLPAAAGRVVEISALKSFALGLLAERTLVRGREVRIGNAAQTLHPVAGQGLNLGLRDAFALVQALRRTPDVDQALQRVEWQRAADRWSMIATTDFLARSFTWKWPGVGAARGLALAALQAAPPLKRALARQMMFGRR